MTDNHDMAQNRIILPQNVIDRLREEGATEIDTGDTRESRANYPHLSHSQISMYLRCSMQYFFRYILGLKDKPKVSLALGLGGHAALEKNIKRKLKSGQDSPTDEVVQWGSDFMDKELSRLPASEIEKDVEPGSTKDKFLAAIKIHQTRDAPNLEPIAAELEFNLDLNELLPEPLEEPMRIANGKIDWLYKDKTTLVVHEPEKMQVAIEDNKFIARKRTQAEVNLSPQLTLYAAAFKKATGHWPTKLGYRMFHPGTTKDGPDAIPLLREPEHMTGAALSARLRRIAFQFARVEHGIRNNVFIPTDDPITCSWCGFRERCQDSLVDDFEAAQIREQTTPK